MTKIESSKSRPKRYRQRLFKKKFFFSIKLNLASGHNRNHFQTAYDEIVLKRNTIRFYNDLRNGVNYCRTRIVRISHSRDPGDDREVEKKFRIQQKKNRRCAKASEKRRPSQGRS